MDFDTNPTVFNELGFPYLARGPQRHRHLLAEIVQRDGVAVRVGAGAGLLLARLRGHVGEDQVAVAGYRDV